jgi:hypothetical protein
LIFDIWQVRHFATALCVGSAGIDARSETALLCLFQLNLIRSEPHQNSALIVIASIVGKHCFAVANLCLTRQFTGRGREKLNQLKKEVKRKGGHAVSVVCDLSDLASVRRAAAEIIALDLPIVGLLSKNIAASNAKPVFALIA